MFTLEEVVPWGRSFDEYRRMFALDAADLRSTILGCADGPASFNAEATRLGAAVVSCDPIYRHDAAALRTRIDATCEVILEQTRRNAGEFVWTVIRSVNELRQVRMAAMNEFLRDLTAAGAGARYVAAALPHLPFRSSAFDLALCSHFLFLYGAQLGFAFHLAALQEMCRIAREVRVFPLLEFGATPSTFVKPSLTSLSAQGFHVSIEQVDYEFQRGGDKMMRIRRSQRPKGG